MQKFHKALKERDLPENSLKKVTINKKEIVLYKVSEKIYATDNLCTHSLCRLEGGVLKDFIIECPCHGGKFDIRTGRVVSLPPVIPISIYNVRIHGDFIEVKI